MIDDELIVLMKAAVNNATHKIRVTQRFIIGLVILVLIMGGGALASSYLEWHQYEATQKQQGQVFAHRLCVTLDQLAALRPPSGAPGKNPSRDYEQKLQHVLAQLKPDVSCPS